MAAKSPDLLRPDQRAALTQIPPDLSDRDIAQVPVGRPGELPVAKR